MNMWAGRLVVWTSEIFCSLISSLQLAQIFFVRRIYSSDTPEKSGIETIQLWKKFLEFHSEQVILFN